jgi:hypothetical protein
MNTCCPKCGGKGTVIISRRVRGYMVSLADWDGTIFDTNMDKVFDSMPKTAICECCGKRVPNPAYTLQIKKDVNNAN